MANQEEYYSKNIQLIGKRRISQYAFLSKVLFDYANFSTKRFSKIFVHFKFSF